MQVPYIVGAFLWCVVGFARDTPQKCVSPVKDSVNLRNTDCVYHLVITTIALCFRCSGAKIELSRLCFWCLLETVALLNRGINFCLGSALRALPKQKFIPEISSAETVWP
jgi:hypothetical protein